MNRDESKSEYMFFYLPHHIKIVSYNDQAIVLNLKEDKYYFLKQKAFNTILFALRKEVKLENGEYCLLERETILPEDFNENIKYLMSSNIIEIAEKIPSLTTNDIKIKNSSGARHINWYMFQKNNSLKISSFLVLRALYFFTFYYLKIKRKSLYSCILQIEKTKPTTNVSDKNLINYIINAVNLASLIFPFQTKCLIFALVLTVMLRKQGFNAYFVVGIQNLPFMSHAWVEVDDKVIADSPSLPFDLAVILKAPQN